MLLSVVFALIALVPSCRDGGSALLDLVGLALWDVDTVSHEVAESVESRVQKVCMSSYSGLICLQRGPITEIGGIVSSAPCKAILRSNLVPHSCQYAVLLARAVRFPPGDGSSPMTADHVRGKWGRPRDVKFCSNYLPLYCKCLNAFI
jgi:hypothetical protein